MIKISREELLRIAELSHLELREDEIAPMLAQLESVLSYAERVQQASADAEEPSNKNINVFREDVVVKTDPELILSQAPEREEHYFVVPSILDGGKKS